MYIYIFPYCNLLEYTIYLLTFLTTLTWMYLFDSTYICTTITYLKWCSLFLQSLTYGNFWGDFLRRRHYKHMVQTCWWLGSLICVGFVDVHHFFFILIQQLYYSKLSSSGYGLITLLVGIAILLLFSARIVWLITKLSPTLPYYKSFFFGLLRFC